MAGVLQFIWHIDSVKVAVNGPSPSRIILVNCYKALIGLIKC